MRKLLSLIMSLLMKTKGKAPVSPNKKGQFMEQSKKQDTHVLVPKQVFTLGSLQVYTIERQEAGHTQLSAIENGFYWCDAGSPQGYGPFNSIHQALKHYEWIIQADKGHKLTPAIIAYDNSEAPAAPIGNNLIRVDFKNKRRVTE